MKLHLVFDDTCAVPMSLRGLIGIDSFGSLVFQRLSRSDAMRRIAEKAGAEFTRIGNAEDRAALMEYALRKTPEKTFVFCPSHFVCVTDPETLSVFLQQVTYAPTPLYMPVESTRARRGWMSMRASLLPEFLLRHQEDKLGDFFAKHGELFVEVRDRVHLIDVSEERTLLHYLSGQFDARHFNTLVHDDYTVTKHSKDRDKLKREFEFYHLVPPEMQIFLVRPFEFKDDGTTASYRMERLATPDMALQWVHSAFQPQEFERFLSHMFHFFRVRPELAVSSSAAETIQQTLYIEKVRMRIDALKRLPEFQSLAPLLERACGGIDSLVNCYLSHFDRLRKRLSRTTLVAGHGDPCFSNILYSKSNHYLKLIDPRGAHDLEDLYTDSYYDIVKLSHSILGNYDFINLNRFDLSVDEDLRLRLLIDHPPPPWAAEMFGQHLQKAGYDPELTRVCEAGLFISMMPLHIDHPRKVLAFAVNAASILSQLSRSKQVRP